MPWARMNLNWNPNVSRGVSLKFRFRAVSYLSWLDGGCRGWNLWEFLELLDLWEFLELWDLWELLRFWFHSSPTNVVSPPRAIHDCHYINGRIQWSELFTQCLFVCLFGSQMYTRHLEMEAYDLRSLSSEWIWEIEQWQLVNFEKQNCNSSFVNLSFKTMFWETGFVNLRCNNLARGVVLIIGKVGICLKISQTKTDSCVA